MSFRLLLIFIALPFTLLAQDDEKPAAVKPGPEYRKFTSKTGKVLLAKVVNRIDDDTYTMETPEGKTYKMSLNSFIKSDAMWLDFWEPEFAVDLSTLETDDALEKMGFTAVSIRNPEIGMIVEVKIGEANLKLLLNPSAKHSILDVESADRARIKITDSSTAFNTSDGKQQKAKQSPNATFQFGDAKEVTATVLVIDLALIGGAKIQKEADGILGADLLPQFNALVDYSAKILYVKP